jgi:branched-chain amino acid transport system substrate-binding protein
MKKGLKIASVLLVCAVAFSFAFAGCSKGSNTIKVGVILPISGQVSTYGIQCRDAIKLAFDEINAAGGVNGKKLEAIVEDDQASPDVTTNAFKKLTSSDKVVAIIGALTSKCSLAIADLAQAKKVVMISPTSTNEKVTLAGDYIFRVCYIDSFQGQVVAKFASETLKGKKAAVLYDVSNDYSVGLTTNFSDKFTSLGGTVVAKESYNTGDKDFNAQLTKIKAAKPDVLFIPDYYSTVSLIMKQVRGQGIKIPLLGADGWDEITNNAGEEALNSFYSNHYSPDANDPDVQKFVTSYKAAFNGTVPNALAALGYDDAYVLAAAIKAAGKTDSAAIRDALVKTNIKLVTGQITFDANRNPVKSAVILEVVKGADGKLTTKYNSTVNP